MHLSEANTQWARRAPDERFGSLTALHDKALGYFANAKEQTVNTEKLRVVARGNDVVLETKATDVALTNWSFGQLATVAGAPSGYLGDLPAKLAAECVNHGLRANGDEIGRDNNLLFRKDEHTGMVTLRALTSERYSRIWNCDITRRLLELEAEGTWRPAPAAFDGSRGLYLSDRDMFCFLVDNERRIFESDKGGGLSRGFFVENSEVGAASFRLKTFYYQYVCGNHNVWGVSGVKEIAIRHVGDAMGKAWGEYEAQIKVYAEASAAEDEARILSMRTMKLGNNLDEVLDTILPRKIAGLSKKVVTAAHDLSLTYEDRYGEPGTVWSLASCLTEIARDLPMADARRDLESAAGKVFELAF